MKNDSTQQEFDTEKEYMVMDDTFDEKAAKAQYDALPEADKIKIAEILSKIH